MEEQGKKRIWPYILVAAVVVLAAVASVVISRYRYFHRYDEFFIQPEIAAEKCIREVNNNTSKYTDEASIYYYLKHRGKKASEESLEIRKLFVYNQLLEGYNSFDSYGKLAEQTLWNLRDYTFSDPEKIIWEKNGTVYFKAQGSWENQYREEANNLTSKLITEYQYDDLWTGFVKAANGNWYLSAFTYIPPYDWAGNEPLTEKNKEYGERFLEQVSEDEIYRLFSLASATQLTGQEWHRGFESPIELGWENFLNLFFASLNESEKEEAYDNDKECYRFTEEQIGRRVWEYLGRDENDKSAVKYDGFPHGSQLLADYIPEDGERETCEFPVQRLLDVKAYATDGMKLTNKELKENGVVLFEIDYQARAGEEDQEAPETNHQILELRAMEQGCRILSYQVIDEAHESEGNRLIEEFAWKQWNLVLPAHYSYENGTDEPEITRKQLTSDYGAARQCIQSMALGKTISTTEFPESAIVTDSISIEAESNGYKRVYDLYNMEAEGKNYLLIQAYGIELAIGNSGVGVSVTFDGIPVTQSVTSQREILCEYEDSHLLRDTVLSLVSQQ